MAGEAEGKEGKRRRGSGGMRRGRGAGRGGEEAAEGGGGGLLRQRVVSREGERLKLFYGHRLFPPSPSPSEDLCV